MKLKYVQNQKNTEGNECRLSEMRSMVVKKKVLVLDQMIV